jgi:copper chaperone CopZ
MSNMAAHYRSDHSRGNHESGIENLSGYDQSESALRAPISEAIASSKFRVLCECSAMEKTNIDNLNTHERVTETKHILIDGMTCDECVRTIERALRKVDGVEQVQVDRSKARATVTYDTRKTNIPALHDTLLKSGYHPVTTNR